jgi:hypothetical protein
MLKSFSLYFTSKSPSNPFFLFIKIYGCRSNSEEVEIHWNNHGGLGGRESRGLRGRKGREVSCEEEETHSSCFLFFI